MPFVQRIIEPRYLARVDLFSEDGTTPRLTDNELEAVTNSTLCNALKQLASLTVIADDIFKELTGRLESVHKRSGNVKNRIERVEKRLANEDPKKVPVPEGDICSFAQTKKHYVAKHPMDGNLFNVDTRPDALKSLYEAATKTPVHAMRQLDRWRKDGQRSSRFFVCTPVLGAKRRKIRGKIDIDIETRMPAVMEDLRRWTSEEALGDVTVGPNCASRIGTILSDSEDVDGTATSDHEGIDHKLPSPEEQLQVVALRFPAEIVAVDISGKSFDRMSNQRRSLTTGELANRTVDGDTVRRRGRTRRPRNRRRNTLAGTDQKEIQNALTAGEDPSSLAASTQAEIQISSTVPRSKSSDLLRSNSNNKKESPEVKISRFDSLKQWGKSQYEKFRNKSGDKMETASTSQDIDDFNLYETVTMKRRRDMDKERKTHERNSSISSSEKSLPTSALTSMMNIAVKLRDSSLQRRQRRQGNRDEPNSSSGNWSASSESGRASIGSEIASTTHPKSTTSAATSSNSLNHPPSSVNSRRRFNFNVSTSGSVTSEGSTLTPDIIHDLHEDGDSVYSCDTEGYYTSFHMDSGLKTLKEEDAPSTPLQSTSAFSNSGSNNTVLSAENEYELFGKGSTSTTTSSAGTVCTTLRAADSDRSLVIGPAVPERKSSLTKLSTNKHKTSMENCSDKTGTVKRSPATKPTVVAVIRKSSGDVSPDSGHNTSSSPIESVSSPNGLRSGSDFEFSESSDMEGPERIERIRMKTTINSSRIPSMCAITPSQSDDESTNGNCSSYKKQVEALNNFRNNLDKENGNFDAGQRIIRVDEQQTLRVDQKSGYVTMEQVKQAENKPAIKSNLLPLNQMLGKLRNLAKRDRSKSPTQQDVLGEYVTLADVRNNNNNNNNEKETSYVNDIVNRNLTTVLSGKIKDTEYVSLNELPPIIDNNNIVSCPTSSSSSSSLERKQRQGARVTLDAEGKVVYSSDSLRRRKPPTTFEPGPFVKTSPNSSPQMLRSPKPVRPVTRSDCQTSGNKFIIKASGHQPELVRTPSAVVQPASPKMRALSPKGAYVHVQTNAPKELREGVPSPDMYAEEPYFCYHHHSTSGNFYSSTLPSKRSQYFNYDLIPERSVTPDITRGLEKGFRSLSSYNQVGLPSDREEASFKVSPIDPRNALASFKASTPSQSVKENLESRLLSPKRSTMSNEELYAVIHKTKKKLNIEADFDRASPPVQPAPESSTPKKISVETGYIGSRQSWSPRNDEKFSPINEPKSRQSWAFADRKGVKKTSTMDFKKLLLQKSSLLSGGSKKMSAVEQLKLSKQQMQLAKENKGQEPNDMTILNLSASPRSMVNRKVFNSGNVPGSPERGSIKAAPKILSPKSQWRFTNPRSDVLSSTIMEDCREDETGSNASKSSLEKRSLQITKNDNKEPPSPSTKFKSVTEKMSAQRAKFFGTDPESGQQKMPPTLETAF